MRRKSWAGEKALEWAGATIPRLMGRRGMLESAIRETIKHCCAQCEGEQYAAEAQLKILALLEPGDEGEAP